MKAIAAMAQNRVIGKNGGLPWPSIKEDFKHFREFTMGQTLIVGWKTFRTLPQLKNRNIRVVDFGCGDIQSQPVENNNGLKGYIEKIQPQHLTVNKNYIVAGGAKTYELFLPHITEFYVTHVNGEFEGDTYMPPFEHLFDKQEVIRVFESGHKVLKYSKNI